MAVPGNEPNQFVLTGRDTQLTYSTSSFIGQPQLSFQHRQTSHSFSGAEIRCQETEIGKLVSVTLEQIPDLRTVTLTLLLPAINLGNTTEVHFRTRAILTTARTSIGGPRLVVGALQTYRVLSLQGTASIVEF